ncbi:uncharacterized protein LOC115634312 [Scaptodrosophila lebanonensis]|uniref:Uncharacterized protein LOC115634312 n=1 Tax=Drosophila lebanonensis TaxID=7225 RepID=A0A6J2UHN8_DROLE|nr:uncharacterized protein LOC115634312 [Scaptodrosophila lebanonensis]
MKRQRGGDTNNVSNKRLCSNLNPEFDKTAGRNVGPASIWHIPLNLIQDIRAILTPSSHERLRQVSQSFREADELLVLHQYRCHLLRAQSLDLYRHMTLRMLHHCSLYYEAAGCSSLLAESLRLLDHLDPAHPYAPDLPTLRHVLIEFLGSSDQLVLQHDAILAKFVYTISLYAVFLSYSGNSQLTRSQTPGEQMSISFELPGVLFALLEAYQLGNVIRCTREQRAALLVIFAELLMAHQLKKNFRGFYVYSGTAPIVYSYDHNMATSDKKTKTTFRFKFTGCRYMSQLFEQMREHLNYEYAPPPPKTCEGFQMQMQLFQDVGNAIKLNAVFDFTAN